MCYIRIEVEEDTDSMDVHWYDSLQREHFLRHIEAGGEVQEWVDKTDWHFNQREIGVMHEMAKLAPKNGAELRQANADLAALKAAFVWDDPVVHEDVVVEVMVAKARPVAKVVQYDRISGKPRPITVRDEQALFAKAKREWAGQWR